MPQDCMKCETDKETKACLRKKVRAIHDAKMAFHKGIELAILGSKDAVIDFKLTELTDNVNRLAAQRKFSAGKFFCDLVLQVAFGPVLGTVMGNLAVREVNAIVRMRSGIAHMEQLVARGARLEAAASRGLRPKRIVDKQIDELADELLAATVKPPKGVAAGLSDVSTGVVVDSFQKINESLFQLWPAPDGEATPYVKREPFDRTVTGQVPTNLEMITNNAESYIKYQAEANAEAKSIHEWLLARTKNREALAAFNGFLDSIYKEFEESEKSSIAWGREIKNLSKMVGILLYWGDPKVWGTPRRTRRTVRQMTEIDVYTDYAFDTTWSPWLMNQVLTNILVPGTTEPFLDYYTRRKSQALGRTSGPGINGQKRHSEMDEAFAGLAGRDSHNAPPASDIGSLSSEYFTAKQSAFYQFQRFMSRVYEQLNASQHDDAFKNLLSREHLLLH